VNFIGKIRLPKTALNGNFLPNMHQLSRAAVFFDKTAS